MKRVRQSGPAGQSFPGPQLATIASQWGRSCIALSLRESDVRVVLAPFFQPLLYGTALFAQTYHSFSSEIEVMIGEGFPNNNGGY